MRKWKVIAEFPLYAVSDDGQIKRIGGRLLRPSKDEDGYPIVSLYQGTRASGRTVKIPVMVMLTFKGPRPTGMEVCHNDGNASNSKLSNLRWDTHSNNTKDAVHHGTHVSNHGSNNGRSKIQLDDVFEMWNLRSLGIPLKEIAEIFGLHREYIRLIFKKKYWAHAVELIT